MKTTRLPVVYFATVTVCFCACAGSAEWPRYQGPNNDNKSGETGLMQIWPEGGPFLVWTAEGMGYGYSSVAVAGGRIYTAGMVDGQTWVTALDKEGHVVGRKLNGTSWQATEQQPWAVPYAGSRGTPTVDGDTVFHLSELGRLAAFDAASGDGKWSVNIQETFDAPRPKYGYSESVLVHGNTLFCAPGGAKGYIVALDKRDGRMVWANTDIMDPIGYASPVITEIGGVEQLINVSAAHVFAVDPKSGRLLWTHVFGNARNNSATNVIVHAGLVFASSGYGKGCVLLRPAQGEDGKFTTEEVWSTELMDNHHGGVVLLDGYLYGSGQEAKGWFCLDFATGKKCWQTPGKGSLTYADNRLYCLDEDGAMTLVEPTPKEWTPRGSFAVPSGGKGAYWAHPVVCGGVLYVRHAENLYAYRVGAK